MKTASMPHSGGLSRIKLFWALSRTPHGLLDMATPGMGVLLWLGAFPAPAVIALGLLTAFSGYTAVYALNDLIDVRPDRQKIRDGAPGYARDLDSVYVRHPIAQGMLSFREGVIWMAGWAALALAGSFMLNPFCTLIFAAACLLEVIYCLLLKVTWLRGIISGVVKNSGAMAAVVAVDPSPRAEYMVALFLWLFFWEIGGQNVPNDWADLDEDRRLRAKTIPVRFGVDPSAWIVCASLALASAMSVAILCAAPGSLGGAYVAGAALAALYFLMWPAARLMRVKTPEAAAALFNRASYYPLAMLLVSIAGRNI